VSGFSACGKLLCRKNCNWEAPTEEKFNNLLCTSWWLEQFNAREVVESPLRDFSQCWQEFDGITVLDDFSQLKQ
jgi:hypothetical protein